MNAALRRLVYGRAYKLFKVRRQDWMQCVHEVIINIRHEGIS